MSTSQTSKPPVWSADSWRRLRRSALVLLLVFGVVVLWVGPPMTCHQELLDGAAVRLCETMRLADPRAGLYLLVAALLLFPEVSELEVGGVLTLRRRLDQLGGETTGLRSELAEIRSQAFALSQSSATNRTEVTNTVVTRPERTGEVLVQATTPSSDETADVDASAYAQLAFVAGVAGLPQALGELATRSTVLAYTPAEGGGWEVNAASAPPATLEVDAISSLMNEQPPEPRVQRMNDRWAVTAPVFDAGGRPLGGVAVVLDPTAPGVPDGLPLTSLEAERLAALGEVAAQVYGRLLVDLLGERAQRYDR